MGQALTSNAIRTNHSIACKVRPLKPPRTALHVDETLRLDLPVCRSEFGADLAACRQHTSPRAFPSGYVGRSWSRASRYHRKLTAGAIVATAQAA